MHLASSFFVKHVSSARKGWNRALIATDVPTEILITQNAYNHVVVNFTVKILHLILYTKMYSF
jgi:hypothetical protein